MTDPRLPDSPAIARRLAALADRPLNFDLATLRDASPAGGWGGHGRVPATSGRATRTARQRWQLADGPWPDARISSSRTRRSCAPTTTRSSRLSGVTCSSSFKRSASYTCSPASALARSMRRRARSRAGACTCGGGTTGRWPDVSRPDRWTGKCGSGSRTAEWSSASMPVAPGTDPQPDRPGRLHLLRGRERRAFLESTRKRMRTFTELALEQKDTDRRVRDAAAKLTARPNEPTIRPTTRWPKAFETSGDGGATLVSGGPASQPAADRHRPGCRDRLRHTRPDVISGEARVVPFAPRMVNRGDHRWRQLVAAAARGRRRGVGSHRAGLLPGGGRGNTGMTYERIAGEMHALGAEQATYPGDRDDHRPMKRGLPGGRLAHPSMIEEPTCLGLGDEFRDTARSRGTTEQEGDAGVSNRS